MTRRLRLEDADLETRQRMRAAAEVGPPRDACPGCLRDLSEQAELRRRGWCLECGPRRDEVLRELLKVVPAGWEKPDTVARAEREVLEVAKTYERLREAAEVALRALSERRVALRYARARARVCLQCGEAPAERTQLCGSCSDPQVRRAAGR